MGCIIALLPYGKGSSMSTQIAKKPPQSQKGKDEVEREVPVEGLAHRPFSDDEIKQAFDCFDLDHNHFVGAAELSQILQLIGEELEYEEIDEMIRMCDADGDGQVTFDEFY